jgi:diadenosine tetraphosphate (Ap4A) HIT family hydrolase
MTVTEDCRLCRAPNEDEQSVDILVNESWHVYAPWQITPGAFMVQTRRHVAGLWLLDSIESESLGGVLRDVADAIRQVYSAEKVYMVALGEMYPHFHVMMLPRVAGMPAEERGLVLLKSYLQGNENAAADRPLVHSVAALVQAGVAGNGARVAQNLAGETVA